VEEASLESICKDGNGGSMNYKERYAREKNEITISKWLTCKEVPHTFSSDVM
jgi:hypothetical protein